MPHTLSIICSDKPRNGKTLLARVLAGRLAIAGPQAVRIFDTDFPEGGIAGYHPQSSQIVNLDRTQGQVQLFDTIINEPGHDYLIDLDHDLLDEFFRIYVDTGFGDAAAAEGLEIACYFILDRNPSTVVAAKEVAHALGDAIFYLVRNEEIGNVLTLPQAARTRGAIRNARDLVLPRLSVKSLNRIEQGEFSFADFIARNGEGEATETRMELWNLLEAVYNQLSVV